MELFRYEKKEVDSRAAGFILGLLSGVVPRVRAVLAGTLARSALAIVLGLATVSGIGNEVGSEDIGIRRGGMQIG